MSRIVTALGATAIIICLLVLSLPSLPEGKIRTLDGKVRDVSNHLYTVQNIGISDSMNIKIVTATYMNSNGHLKTLQLPVELVQRTLPRGTTPYVEVSGISIEGYTVTLKQTQNIYVPVDYSF